MTGLMVALALAFGVVATSIVAFAQRPTPPPRVAAVLATSSAAAYSPRVSALQQGLRDLGYAEGRDLALDVHAWGGGDPQLAHLAAALVDAKPAVIVAESNSAILVLKHATVVSRVVWKREMAHSSGGEV